MAVRKHKIRSEKTTRRVLIAALALLCVIVAGAFVLINGREAAVTDLPRGESTAVVYQNRSIGEIAALTVENSTGAYTVLQQNGAFTLAGQPDFEFSSTMLQAALHNAALIATEKTLLTVVNDWKSYGLDDGSIRVAVQYTDGTGIAFRIGPLLPEETPLYYFRVEGDNRLGAVSQDVQETYAMSVNALHRVTNPALNADLIDRIAFTGENPFSMERRADGWYLTAPFCYPLAQNAVQTVLKNLENLRFSQFVSHESAADLPALGLAPARRTLTLSIAPSIVTGYDENGQAIGSQTLGAYELTFDCGNDIGDILFYCLYRGEVVKATRFSSGLLLTQSYEKLLLTRPFNIPTNLLTRLEWTQNGETRAWDVTLHERVLENASFETDATGNILYDVRVHRDGAAIDENAFLLAYARLTDVTTVNALPAGYTLSVGAQPEVVIRLIFDGGVREAAFYPYDALHWAVAVDGTPRFYVSREALTNVRLP